MKSGGDDSDSSSDEEDKSESELGIHPKGINESEARKKPRRGVSTSSSMPSVPLMELQDAVVGKARRKPFTEEMVLTLPTNFWRILGRI